MRTNILLSAFEEPKLVLLITSSEPSEGKSSVTANLGIAMAQSGKRTLIIDCDFRRPVIGKIFNISEDARGGFVDMIVNAARAGRAKKAAYPTAIPALKIIPCGTIPPNPSELLGSIVTQKIIEALKKDYDVILLDSSPITAVTDPLVLSRAANGVVLVVQAGKTKRTVIQYASAQLRNARANIIGGVLNGVDFRKNGYYYGYQHAEYYQQE